MRAADAGKGTPREAKGGREEPATPSAVEAKSVAGGGGKKGKEVAADAEDPRGSEDRAPGREWEQEKLAEAMKGKPRWTEGTQAGRSEIRTSWTVQRSIADRCVSHEKRSHGVKRCRSVPGVKTQG